MLNKVKEMSSTIGEKVVKNKKKIAIVAAGVAVGAYGVFIYKNVKGMEKTIIEGAKGSYELVNFPDSGQMISGDGWLMLSDMGSLQPEVIIDALRNTFGLVDI